MVIAPPGVESQKWPAKIEAISPSHGAGTAIQGRQTNGAIGGCWLVTSTQCISSERSNIIRGCRHRATVHGHGFGLRMHLEAQTGQLLHK